MIDEKKWPRLLKNKFIKVNVSSYSKKKFMGFLSKEHKHGKKKLKNGKLL